MSRPHLRVLLGLFLAFVASSAFAQSATVNVIPQPLSVQTSTGAATVITTGVPITVPAGDAQALEVAQYLAALSAESRGLKLTPGAHALAGKSTIALVRRANPAQGAEGYSLDIADGHATITAATTAGLFYGANTLWQLMTPDDGRGRVALAAVHIEDRPRFAWRGILLDSARHFQSAAFVERMIDWMALHKLNVLQWHLTDDQAWRLEIKAYPKLTQVGAWRIPASAGPQSPLKPYGGFYTQDQVRHIVAHARLRHVTIVPEIEMPGHALSAILAYPELASAPGATPAIQSDWGIFPNLYAPSDKTFTFLEGVLTEVMDLFPSAYIDIGGDEAVKDQWRASPAIQAQIKALGLANEDALQGWFTSRIGAFLKAHGRKLIGWDDILVGGPPADAAVMSWHLEGALNGVHQGHDAVIATDPILYFDHRQSDAPDGPPGRGSLITLRDVYGFEPAPASLPPQERDHIMGVQANVWTEHIRTEARVVAMTFPRAAAVAELGWAAPERKDWTAFEQRLPALFDRYHALGLKADESVLHAQPTPNSGRLASQQLTLCANKLALNLEGGAEGGRTRPVYLVDILNPCWAWNQADLTGVGALTISVGPVPFNYQIGADRAKIPLRAPTTAQGELEVRLDGCAGNLLATVPLARPALSAGATTVSAAIPPVSGRHDLCFMFTARSLDPMWAIDWVQLGPQGLARAPTP